MPASRRVRSFAALLLAPLLVGWFAPLARAHPGDITGDGIVDAADAAILLDCLHGPEIALPPQCAAGDITGNGWADLADVALLARLFDTRDCSFTASASSIEGPDVTPDRAVDGMLSTRWSSAFADNQWLQLSFGYPRTLTGLTIEWETAYAVEYGVLLSDNGTTWRTAYSTTSGDGGVDEVGFAPDTALHLRIHCTRRATVWGNSIWEVTLHSSDTCYRPCMEHADREERIDCLVNALTLEEQTSFVHGTASMELRGIPRLGIPRFKLADGPLGARAGGDAPIGTATAFPAPIAMAATWDTDLVEQFGVAIGREFRNEGRQMWLGPGMNIIRIPQNGRNFEYYSEDPYLAGRMAAAAVRGAQAQGVVATAKHFACNNQETNRGDINVIVDERTLREIYLVPFETAVRDGGALAIMAAYNRVNGPYCSANTRLLTDVLKNDWGFRGLVVSDWGAVHETVAPANAGLDLEMPSGGWWSSGQLLAAVQSGQVSAAAVADKVRRILRALAHSGVLDGPWDVPNENLTENWTLARTLAARGAVLLKNAGGVLPLDRQATQTIAVLGPNYAAARTGGGGSSHVTPPYSVSPLQGLASAAGPGVTLYDEPGIVTVDDLEVAGSTLLSPFGGGGQHGLLGEYFNNGALQGTPALTRIDSTVNFHWGTGTPGPGVNADYFSVRWRGTLTVPITGTWTIGMATDDGVRLYLDGALLIDDWRDHGIQLTPLNVTLTAGQPYQLVIEYYENGGNADAVFYCDDQTALTDAAALAASADTALVFIGTSAETEGEGYDRPTLELPPAQDALVRAVAAANPRTVVVVVAGSQVGMWSWIDDVPAALQAWFGGQEAGNAIADVLFGDVNPGAKLPMTFVRQWADHPASTLYPGGAYTDGLAVGYRYFDGSATAPLFPFGHGLSYTSFAYSGLTVDTTSVPADGIVRVSFAVQNTGARAGAEAAQVYVRDVAASVWRPAKELKGFARVTLEPGASQVLTVELDRRAFAFWDTPTGTWRVEPGEFEILVAASAADVRLSQVIVYP